MTAPNLAARCSYAEHIVRARGRRTAFTSVSLHPDKIHDFGDILYQVKRPKLDDDGHLLVEHLPLLAALRDVAKTADKADRLRAVQAIRYSTRRSEGLIDWKFDISGVAAKDQMRWARSRVSPYFEKKS